MCERNGAGATKDNHSLLYKDNKQRGEVLINCDSYVYIHICSSVGFSLPW